jgi:hypothetical protein
MKYLRRHAFQARRCAMSDLTVQQAADKAYQAEIILALMQKVRLSAWKIAKLTLIVMVKD